MTQPTPDRPQPVLNASKLGGLAQAAVVMVLGAVVVIQQGISAQNISAIGAAIAGAVTAVAALVTYLISVFHGRAAAEVVTPLSAPQNDNGVALVPDPLAWRAAPQDGVHDAASHVQASIDYTMRNYSGFPDHYADYSPSTRSRPPVPDPQYVTEHLPEVYRAGMRLGRHVRHDPRSLNYRVPETDTPTTAFWQRMVPVFDQGNLGSCTGNAAAGVLGTAPFYATLPAGFTDDENEAVKLYSLATQLDGYSGAYPPDDTGSDGLSVAKAAKQLGLISGYQHITSVAAAQTAIKSGPFIVGTNWYEGMDSPDASGRVVVSGSIRGGHEFECHGYDAAADLWWFTNSWGTGWGKNGTFCMSSASFARLLAEQGDATVFLPVAAPTPPPPTPQPQPPAPGPSGFPLAAWQAYDAHPESRPKAKAMRAAVDAWLNGG